MNSTDRPGADSADRGEVELRPSLRHGGKAETTLRYERVGHGSRLLILGGGISAGRHVVASSDYPEPGWWEAQAPTFDLTRYQLLAIDWVGADGATDVPIDASDQADAIAALIVRLGIGPAHAFIGASYGGMVALHFAIRHPQLSGPILVISAAASSHPFASACRSLQRRVLALAEAVGDPSSGVALARAMAMLTYRTPEEFEQRFADAPSIADGSVRVASDDYLHFHGRRHVGRMSSAAYRRLSESIDLHRIDPSEVPVPATFAGVDSDALVPLSDVEAIAAAVPDGRFRPMRSIYGHDAFLKEDAQVAAIIIEFLQSVEASA